MRRLLWLCPVFYCFTAGAQTKEKMVSDASAQFQVLTANVEKNQRGKLYMPRTFERDSLKLVATRDWTSGFYPGSLWYLFELTGDAKWRQLARKYTLLEAQEMADRTSHDVGFKINCSAGNGFRLTKDPALSQVMITAAKTLIQRFDPKVGVIKSWDFSSARNWKYPVIIDNMMNLELLFEAFRLTQDSSFFKAADTHAQTTLRNHYRADNSSYHVVDYDTETGAVRQRITFQGMNDSSSWSRGQAWGLYGFTMCYRETGRQEYLDQANKIAAYLMKHPAMPADGVPAWDLNDRSANAPKDASAAAVVASALMELANYSPANMTEYNRFADKIIRTLGSSKYMNTGGRMGGFILAHSTGNKPAGGEIDVPLIYADYYFLEALQRQRPRKDRR